jgi:hypothetical protein
MKRAFHGERGAMTPLAYLIVGSIAIVAAIGLRARTSELDVEARSLCRVKARWAAESGISRARSELSVGRMPSTLSGFLSSAGDGTVVRYRLDVGRGGGSVVLEAEGTCTRRGDRPVSASIVAELKGGGSRWRVVEWSEPTAAERESDDEEEEEDSQ